MGVTTISSRDRGEREKEELERPARPVAQLTVAWVRVRVRFRVRIKVRDNLKVGVIIIQTCSM
jgi:hypothetical protein